MKNRYVDAPGRILDIEALRSPKARDLAERLARGSLAYASLVECRATEGFDVVVLEVETEVPQIRDHDIRPIERLAVCFDHADSATPDVLALREDFPATAHLYPPVEIIPKQLCLFEEEYSDIRRRWTSAFFMRRLQDWFRLTARGELHAVDQPLEQALAGTGHRIILPHSLSVASAGIDADQVVPLEVTSVDEHQGRFLIQAEVADGGRISSASSYLALLLTASPRGPRAINSTPRNISELHSFLSAGGDDLLDVLRRRLLDWPREPKALAAQLLLIVRIPKRRNESGPVERVETWGFLGASVREIGVALGIWELNRDGIALMIPARTERRGELAPLDGLSVHFRISRTEAANLNGRETADDRRIIGIGAGALGSQIILNSARAGGGRWTIVDRDRLLPHNLARHALGEFGSGHHKAIVLAAIANRLTDDADAFEPIVADILTSGSVRATLDERLQNADLIVDFAASIPVSRYLAHEAPGPAKRVAFFLNPLGSDLIMLAEDQPRQTRLDALEMQYYRAVLREERLRNHFGRPEGRVRYGTSCRDVSLRLPQALVALHAGIATRHLPIATDQHQAAIRIWQTSDSLANITALDIPTFQVTRQALGEWTVVYDDALIETIQRLRAERLPNETGGVLIGGFDVERKTIYVVDTILSPLDSHERLTLYVRGSEGLQAQLADARQRTFEQLEYVGEWHSHPDGYDCLPSGDDLNVLAWLSSHMDADGVPGVMMIACEQTAITVLLAHFAGSD